MGDRGFQSDDKERVRAASDIAEVLREHLALTPKGREFVALCPFHDDHKPSMYVVPGKQIYHCFSCGASGDVFTFVQKYLGLDFPAALEMLADRAGIELTRRAPIQREDDGSVSLEQIREALTLAQDFYKAALHKSDHGRAAREMIRARGISDAMVEKFALGAAPEDWERLCRALRTKGVTDEAMVAAGVAKARESGGAGGGCFDMLRNRLVFPIHGQHGRPIAFGGRKINPEDEPKYLNTPETTVFKKGRTLYGLSQAMSSIIKTGRVVVVEGYIDVIACHQYGFNNVVATLGTALTRDHARLLRGRAREVVLLFDADEAGRRAAFRAGEVFFSEPLDVRVATPAGEAEAKDPDELLSQEGGLEVFEAMLERSRDVLELRLEALRDRIAGAGPAGLTAAVEEELRRLVDLGLNELPPLRRRFIIAQVARVLGIGAHDIERLTPRGRSARRDSDAPGGAAQNAASPTFRISEPMPLGEFLLACAIACPEAVAPSDRDLIRPDAYSHPLLGMVAQGVQTVMRRGGSSDLGAMLAEIRRAAPGSVADGVASSPEDAAQAAVLLCSHVTRMHEDRRGEDHTIARLKEAWTAAAARARRDGIGARTIELKPTPTDAGSFAAALSERVRSRRTLGIDPRALPRPYEG